MARRRPSRAPAALTVLAVCGLGVLVFVGVRLPQADPPAAVTGGKAASPPREPPVVTPAVTRRVPVGGAPGFFVVIRPDGTSELETPSGISPLVDAATAAAPSEDDLVRRVSAARVETLPRKTALGQVLVLDDGVVDVPADATVTFVGPDRAVAVLRDGTSAVYHADGRVERRDSRRPKSKDTP